MSLPLSLDDPLPPVSIPDPFSKTGGKITVNDPRAVIAACADPRCPICTNLYNLVLDAQRVAGIVDFDLV